MQQRRLVFKDFSEVLAEVDRLHQYGYQKAGQWNLAQNCDHLSFFFKGCLDGFQFKVPWVFKKVFGKMVLNRILQSKSMSRGKFTPQKPLPSPDVNEAEAVARFKDLVERFRIHQGDYHDSPFFGHLTREQWHELNLIHCQHHLGFLIPS